MVLLCLTLGALTVWVLAAARAEAHAALRSSEPSNGEVLDEAPSSVQLTFTEPPELSLSSIEVVGAKGRTFQNGPLITVSGDELTIRQALSALPDGVYTVTWKVVSPSDGHTTAGAFAFGVGASPLEAPPTTAGDVTSSNRASPLEVASRWMFLVGLVTLVGSTATALVAFGDTPGAVRRLAVSAWVVSVVGLAGLAAAQRNAAGVGLGALVGTTVGRELIWRAASIMVAGGALVAARLTGDRGRRVMIMVAATAGAAAMLAEAWGGHAGGGRSFRLARVGAQWVHLAAAGVWLGGLAALLVGVRGAASERKGAAVRRFSALAGGALAVVAATGIFRAVNEVDAWGKLFSTAYGRGVLAKAGLILALASLGAINRYRNVPRAGQTLSGLRRISEAELGVAALALAIAALLAALPPPRTIVPIVASATRPGSIRVISADAASSVRVRLEVDPGVPGLNRFLARIAEYRSGEPVDAAVTLVFSHKEEEDLAPRTLDLEPRQPGTYEGTGTPIALDGPWSVTAVVRRGDELLEVALDLVTRCAAEIFLEGPPTIYEMPVSAGSVQGYVEPGTRGATEVHFSYVDDGGIEIPIEGKVAITASGGKESIELRTRRLSPGHLVSRADLDAGRWRFEIVALSSGGDALRACFEENVGA